VKLLSAFLQCFDDEFASVRAEACIASGRLRIHDNQVINRLSNLIRDDDIHRVKALAIQGLSDVVVIIIIIIINVNLYSALSIKEPLMR